MEWRRSKYSLLFPVVLTTGILLIPLVTDYSDHELVVQALGTGYAWATGHLIAAAAFGICVLASGEVVEAIETRKNEPPGFSQPLSALGASLYAAGLGADGLAPVALDLAGASPILFFDGSSWLVPGLFALATLLFGVALISLVGAAIRAGLLQGAWRWVTFLSALVFVAAPMILSGYALYGVAAAALGVYLPLAGAIARSR